MIQAKELVNTFYQPLGRLLSGVSSDTMWEYSKDRAIEWCNDFINLLESLHNPEYTTFITQDAEFDPGRVKTDAETCDGYELIQHYEQLKKEIESL